MFDKWRKYSYAAQKDQRHRIRGVLVWLAAFFVIYVLLTTFVVSTRYLENDTMEPGLRRGDRMIFSSHIIFRFLPDSAGAERLHRGNIVLVDTGNNQGISSQSGLNEHGGPFFDPLVSL